MQCKAHGISTILQNGDDDNDDDSIDFVDSFLKSIETHSILSLKLFLRNHVLSCHLRMNLLGGLHRQSTSLAMSVLNIHLLATMQAPGTLI